MVGTDSWTTGIPGVTVTMLGDHQTIKVKTDANGKFSEAVPIGTYKLAAKKNGMSIAAEPFSYENPSHVTIAPGGCAQVEFTGSIH